MSVKIVVAGSRSINNYDLIRKNLDEIILEEDIVDRSITIVSGGARGPDKLGERYARERNHKIDKYPANWKEYGKSAGYIRNKKMASVADIVVCFWDNRSPGTKHMIDLSIAESHKKGSKLKSLYVVKED